MKNEFLSLNKLKIGNFATVENILAKDKLRRRLLDLGVIIGSSIEALYISPSGDPVAYLIRGAVIALRSEDAEKIIIKIA